MQRRAATVSVAIFVLLAAGAYSYIGVAQQPEVSLEDPDYEVSADATLTFDGTAYTFTDVGDGSATAEWTNESAQYTETWEVNDTVVYQGDNYTVVVPDQSENTEFELREVQTIDRPTIEDNGTTYVVVEVDGERQLFERDEYLGDQTVYRFVAGDTIERPDIDHETRVGTVSESSVTIEWFAPRTNELSFSQGSKTTIAGTDYLAHFPSEGTLRMTTDFEDYQSDLDAQSEFKERMNGLWGVVIVSGAAAVLLVMLAFMPSRY